MGVRHGISARVYASGNRKRRFAPLSGLIFQLRETTAGREVRLSPHDDISLHATVGGYRAGTQAFHDYADKSSGGALLEFGFIYDDDEQPTFPLFMDDEKKAQTPTTFIYEGATEIETSRHRRVARLLDAPARYSKNANNSTSSPRPRRPKDPSSANSSSPTSPKHGTPPRKQKSSILPSNASRKIYSTSSKRSNECITTTKTPTTTTTASSLLRRIYKRDLADTRRPPSRKT